MSTIENSDKLIEMHNVDEGFDTTKKKLHMISSIQIKIFMNTLCDFFSKYLCLRYHIVIYLIIFILNILYYHIKPKQ